MYFELQMEQEINELKRQRDNAQSQLEQERSARKEIKVRRMGCISANLLRSSPEQKKNKKILHDKHKSTEV